jgi:hypothetical protein
MNGQEGVVHAAFARIVAIVAMLIAAAALAVALMHGGPSGPAGPAGPAGQTGEAGHAAVVAHLGVCELSIENWSLVAQSDPSALVITAPVVTDGVPSCPQGQFVSIVPGQ